MKIEIETNFLPLIYATDDLPKGIHKTIIPIREKRDVGIGSVAIGIFSFVSGVSASVFANWIYDKIKNKPQARIKINRKEITINKASIVKVITEAIEINNND